MGVITWVDGKFPAFMTFSTYTEVLNELVESKRIRDDVCSRAEYNFFPKCQKKLNKEIRRYMEELRKRSPQEFINRFFSIRCEGEEARDNITRFLDAAGDKYKYGFIPCGNSSDVRYPYGKQFWLVALSGFFKKKPTSKFFIDVEKVDYFWGSINGFIVSFSDGSTLRMERGTLSMFIETPGGQ